jgi:hypothetical protein
LRWFSLALVLVGCNRSFPTPSTAPRLDSFDPASGFGGQVLTLRGDHFATGDFANTLNQVRFGTADVAVTVVSATELQVTVPDLGDVPQSFPISVTNDGVTATAPSLFSYLGPGHPRALGISSGADLSPTPTSISVYEGVQVVTLVRNNSVSIHEPSTGLTLSYGTNGEPFSSFLTCLSAACVNVGFGELLPGGPPAFYNGGRTTLEGAPFSAQGQLSDTPFQGPPSLLPVVGLRRGLLVLGASGANPSGGSVLQDQLSEPLPDNLLLLGNAFQSTLVDGGWLERTAAAGVTVPDGNGGIAVWSFFDADTGGLEQPLDGGNFSLVGLTPPDGGGPIATLLPAEVPLPAGALTLFPLSVGFSPDGSSLVLSFTDAARTRLSALQVNLTDLSSNAVALPPFQQNDQIIVGVDRLATWSSLGETVDLYDLSNDQLVNSVTLPGPAYTVTRDLVPPYHLYAAVASPPEVVELDPESGEVLSERSLQGVIGAESISPDGNQVAVATTQEPALVVLDGHSLSETSAFQPLAPPEQLNNGAIGQFTWLPEEDAGYALCAGAFYPQDGAQAGSEFRCGPAGQLFTQGPSGSLAPGVCRVGQETLGTVLQMQSLTLSDGGLELYTLGWPPGTDPDAGPPLGTRWGCDVPGGCIQNCQQQIQISIGEKLNQFVVHPSGRALAISDRNFFAIDSSGQQTLLCGTGNGCYIDQNSLAGIDPSGRWAVLGSHLGGVFDLESNPPQMVAQLLELDDIDTALGFSADSKRFYLGTLLGHVSEYSLEQLPQPYSLPDGGSVAQQLNPERSVYVGFGVGGIQSDPTGSKLLMFEFGSDRISVVQ